MIMSNSLSRRGFFSSAAAGLAIAPLLQAATHPFTHPLGVQLYTVRSLLPEHDEPTIKAIAEIGYKEVEVIHGDLARLAPLLKQYNLKPVSCHFETAMITGNWPNNKAPANATWEAAIDDAKKFGVEYMVMPYLPPAERGDLNSFKALTEKMNKAARQTHAAGLQFCYHNHAFEFKGEPGQRPIDVMLKNLDAKTVAFEMDVFWVSVAGNDPVALMKQLKGRVPLLHLKDKKKDTAIGYVESVSHDTFKEVGHGSLDFPAILHAAPVDGVKHYFVEQDYTPGDPVASLKQSYEFLRGLRV